MRARRREWEVPGYFNPANGSRAAYQPQPKAIMESEARSWISKYDLKPADQDKRRTHLLVIDAQVDFSFPEGALYVAGRSGTGGIEANLNLARFIYGNLELISEISCTLDTHTRLQIFFPAAHLRTNGEHPAPHTVISAKDYETGRYRPSPILAERLNVDLDWLTRQFAYYCRRLEATRKHELYLWPVSLPRRN